MITNFYKKITNLLGNTSDKVPRFIAKNWIEVHDQSGNAENRYNSNKQIRFKTSMLRSDLCDYSDAYIVVKGNITVTNPDNDAYDKKLAFKNNAPFTSCISKINNTLIDNVEDLNVVMPKDEPNSGLGGDNNNINYSIKDSKSFDYETSIIGKLESNNVGKGDVKIVVPLK